jgi:hypothetical protein
MFAPTNSGYRPLFGSAYTKLSFAPKVNTRHAQWALAMRHRKALGGTRCLLPDEPFEGHRAGALGAIVGGTGLA